MKLPVQQLVKLIREIVADEAKKVLPGLVERVLTEQYVRKIVLEGNRPGRSRPNISETMMGMPEEEVTPEPMQNTDEGIYAEDPLTKKNESIVRELIGKNPAMAMIYEGVKPLSQREAQPSPGEVPESALRGLDFGKMQQIAFGRKPQESYEQQSSHPEMRRLEEQRRRLDERVVGNPSQRQPQRQMIPMAESPRMNSHMLSMVMDDNPFPTAPIEIGEG